MIVSHRHRFCYLPPERTGSQSVWKHLTKHYGPIEIWRGFDKSQTENLLRYNDMHVCEVPDEWADYTIFATIRNPFEHLVSMWVKLYHSQSFDSFLDLAHHHRLTVLLQRTRIDHYLRVESLSDDFQALPFASNNDPLPHVNAVSYASCYITPEQERRLFNLVSDDFSALGYAATYRLPNNCYGVDLPCEFRRESIGTQECRECGDSGRDETIYACQTHGKCTLRQATPQSEMADCFSCPDRRPPQRLGDYVARGAALLGIGKTEDCNCPRRQEELNRRDEAVRAFFRRAMNLTKKPID